MSDRKPLQSAAVLELRGVRKRYGAVAAVDGVDLALKHEEFLTFLGPSGSGKTTTLMMVAGLQQADEGSIVLDGKPVDGLPPYRRDIGMVFQHYALFPHMSVGRNIAFPLEMRGIAKADRDRQVVEALRLVGLEGFETRLPRQLSGGQQQRVALARALVYRPALLLMDEPLGALDKKLREQMQREIKRVHRERRSAVLYVTHDQEEALTLSDRIAVFNKGRIEQIGSPDELYDRPRTRFVADFIGETNFFPGRVVAVAERTCTVDLGGFVAGAAMPVALRIGDAATVAVRPEAVGLSQPDDGEPGIAATLADVIYLGNARRLILKTRDGRECLVLRQASDAICSALALGASATLSWAADRATAFAQEPAASGTPGPRCGAPE